MNAGSVVSRSGRASARFAGLQRFGSFLLALLIFSVVPVSLFELALYVIQDTRWTRATEEIRIRHEKILAKVGVMDDRVAFTALTVKLALRRAQREGMARAKTDLEDMNRHFSGAIDMFYFSADGKLIEEISSRKNGRRFMESCYQALAEMCATMKPSKTNQSLLRQMLKMPHFASVVLYKDGRAMPIGQDPSAGYFFYQLPMKGSSNQFGGYMGFLDPQKIDPDFPARCAIDLEMKKNRRVQLGIVDLESSPPSFYPQSLERIPGIRTALIRTQSTYSTYHADKDQLISVIMRKGKGLLVAVEPVSGHLSASVRWLLRFALIIWTVYLCVSAWIQSRSDSKISLRIIRLFLYAVCLPSGLLVVGGYRAFQDHILVLQSDLENNMRSKLRQFDERFPRDILRVEALLKTLKEEVEKQGSEKIPAIFKKIRKERAITDLLVIDADGRSVWQLRKAENDVVEQRYQVGRFMAREILRRLNGIDKVDGGTLVAESVSEMAGDITSAAGWGLFQRNLGQFTPFGLDNEGCFMLFDAIYDGPGAEMAAKRQCNQIMNVVMFRPSAEAYFFRRHRKDIEQQPDFKWQVSMWAYQKPHSAILSDKSIKKEVEQIGREIDIQRAPTRKIVDTPEGKYLVIGQPGHHLTCYAYVARAPLAPLENRIRSLWYGIGGILSILLISTVGIGMILSKQLLWPISDIGEGMRAIQERNFNHTVPVRSGDELGKVSALMNEVIEGMQDLSVARAIQENLFPKGELYAGGLRVYGRSRTLSDVGGDYYDYVAVDDDTVFGLVGDVSGHGVSAALIMGMAKCFFTLADRQNDSLEKILSDFNLYLVSTVQRMKMMTLVTFRWRKSSRTLEFANAGHIPPMIWRAAANTVEEISLPCMPLGIGKKGGFRSGEVLLGSGDAVFLYTDGLPEARTENRQELDYESSVQWFRELSVREPQEVVEAMFKKLDAYIDGASSTDDVTMICLRAD